MGSQKRHGRFINPYVEDRKHNLWDVICWHFGYYDEPPAYPPPDFSYPAKPPSFIPTQPSAVWIGHSTYLIQIDGITFLTDPHLTTYCAPIPIRSLRRRHNPGLEIDELPPIDVILLSHDHYDHLDKKSINLLQRRHPNITCLVPHGLAKWFRRQGIKNVFEMNWGETHQNPRFRATAVPAQHFSGRSLWDNNRTLWCGYVVECKGKTFYFVGDTGYNPYDFKEIGNRWPSIDLTLIPIGAYAPRRFMKAIHISPEEAVQLHSDVRSRLSLGMHWKTFWLSDEPLELPPYDLFLAMKERQLPFETFLPIEPGLHVNW
jgi:N-acyl-phosphatidylethanolamine-hydrolysing phospholipase D